MTFWPIHFAKIGRIKVTEKRGLICQLKNRTFSAASCYLFLSGKTYYNVKNYYRVYFSYVKVLMFGSSYLFLD